MAAEAESIVMVPVPTADLEAVYGLLASRMAGRTQVQDRDPTGVHVAGQGVWNENMVTALKRSLSHLPGARQLLDAAAKAAPDEVSMQDVADAAGIERNTVRAQMGALTKLSVKLFGHRTWPVSVRYDEQGRALYAMSPEIATWWNE